MCALFGSARDISMFRYVNRELMGNIISQECVYYKHNLVKTSVNIYGEAAEGRYFQEPVILNCLIERKDQNYSSDGIGVDFEWGNDFSFLIDDLTDANLYPEVGDIIMYQEGYFENVKIITNQQFMGKDPNYPYTDSSGNNPLNPGLNYFGYNTSVICQTRYVPQDLVNIVKARL